MAGGDPMAMSTCRAWGQFQINPFYSFFTFPLAFSMTEVCEQKVKRVNAKYISPTNIEHVVYLPYGVSIWQFEHRF